VDGRRDRRAAAGRRKNPCRSGAAVASRRQWLDTEVRTQARLAAPASSDQSQTNNQGQALLTQGID